MKVLAYASILFAGLGLAAAIAEPEPAAAPGVFAGVSFLPLPQTDHSGADNRDVEMRQEQPSLQLQGWR